jgi:hypothetical protein
MVGGKKRSGSTDGSLRASAGTGDENGRPRPSPTARVRTIFEAISKIHALSEERSSKRSRPFRTPSHVSSTTCSATARLET